MKKIILISLISLLYLCSGCSSSSKDEPISGVAFSKYFITSYTLVESMKIVTEVNGCIPIMEGKQIIGAEESERMPNLVALYFKGEVIPFIGSAERETYERLSARYGDNSYNNLLVPFINPVIYEESSSVKLICHDYFDAQHPAESSLGDIVKLDAMSAYKFIQSRYKTSGKPIEKPYDKYIFLPIETNGRGNYSPIFDFLDNINVDNDNGKLFYPIAMLYFTKEPEAPGTYSFTVTFNFDDKVISEDFIHTW